MRVSRNAVLASIESLLPDSSVNMGESEIDYIGGLDEPYRGLAILQAALSQVLRNGGPQTLESSFRKSIKSLSEEISATQVKAYNSKQAWTNEFGDFGKLVRVDSLNDNVLPSWTNHDCELCRDTGWVANYNTIGRKGKNPCTCEKGLEKKQHQNWQTAAGRDFQKAQEIAKKALQGSQTATGVEQMKQPFLLPLRQEPVKVPSGPPELPKKGRKFR